MFESTFDRSLGREGFSWSLFKLAAIGLALTLVVQLIGAGFDAWRLTKLDVGMAQGDVRKILGQPDHEWDSTEWAPKQQAPRRQTLIYSRWLRDDIFVEIDDTGHVVSIERGFSINFISV